MYSKENFTYGYEIEWGDIDRNVDIPSHLGSWEYCECDILNLNPPYRGLATDPMGINPPVGGEINTKPTNTIEEQVDRVMEIKSLFDNPTASCVNHGHTHVRVPGLRNDMEALNRLVSRVWTIQDCIIETAYQFKEDPTMKGDKNKTYLKLDGGRKMPEWLMLNLATAENFDDWVRIYQCGKDAVSRGRPLRFAVNFYCLKHTDTIEFRCLRSTTDEEEIRDSFRFTRDVIAWGLGEGPDPRENTYKLPPFNYSRWESDAWGATKKKSDASLKKRTLHDVA